MRILTLLLLLTALIGCADRNPDTTINHQAAASFNAIDAKFPLDLGTIDLNGAANVIALNDGIVSGIMNTVQDYYTNDCLNDSLHTYMDTYISTIRLHDSLTTTFVILLKHYPSEEVTTKVLFYDNEKKEFIGGPLDFKIYALFEFKNGQLKPTDLKTDFNIDGPEIQLVDFDNDGIHDLKFTRLFHNGTFNAIHESILTVKDSRLDTLHFEERSPLEHASE
ncbi:MAG TPA: hypothetical protein VHL77_11475 [Ferruginibacter sp.]|nr:hypothetical protein [Ferruginibacter sp.]